MLLLLQVLALTFNVYGQSPKIEWYFNTNDFSAGQSAAADLDGDGLLEVVFGCYRHDSMVYVLHGKNGNLFWKYNTHSTGAEGCNDVAPIIYDVNGDGYKEVIVPSSCNPKTFCFYGAIGTVKWVCNTRGSDSPPTIADIDQDGKPEILHGEFGGYVLCINAEDGSKAWELKVDTDSWVQTAPSIVDLNQDGVLDFVVATWNFHGHDSVYAFNGKTRVKLWSYPILNHVYHGTAIADLDGDHKPELLIGSYNDTLYCINGENGSTAWKYKGSGYVGAPVSIADLDHNDTLDLVFVNGGYVTALTGEGKLKWNFATPSLSGAFRGVALSDITSDLNPDVIFGTGSGQLIALHGENGQTIWSIDLASHYGNANFQLNHAPLVADFDGDDTLDVFIVGGYGTYPDFLSNFGRAYMIQAGKGNGPEWLMFQKNILRQSALSSVILSQEPNIESYQESNIIAFPNPAVNEISFKLESNSSEIKEISIYNLMGQLVFKKAANNDKTLKVNTSNLPEGIYKYWIQTENLSSFKGSFVIQNK